MKGNSICFLLVIKSNLEFNKGSYRLMLMKGVRKFDI